MNHENWMKQCLRLARKGIGKVSPNPAVGAIIVAGGKVLAAGFHKRFGEPHAEVNCLSNFHGDPRKATLYVNLEPCVHSGKTPPCADLVIESGIRNVVVGILDPNPLVSGRGVRKLRKAGVRVTSGACEDECRMLNRTFFKNMTSGFPYIHLKVAVSIDGKLRGQQKWVTSWQARREVHHWRARHDAVLVGAGTVIRDDPRLNVRLVRGRDSHVVIIDGNFRVPSIAKVFSSAPGRRVLLCSSTKAIREDPEKVNRIRASGAEILPFPAKNGRIALPDICKTLLKNNIGSILVEGGEDVSGGFISAGLVDELSIFAAPVVLGGNVNAFRTRAGAHVRQEDRMVRHISARRTGTDLLLSYFYN